MGTGKTWGIIAYRDAKLNVVSDEEREEVKRYYIKLLCLNSY